MPPSDGCQRACLMECVVLTVATRRTDNHGSSPVKLLGQRSRCPTDQSALERAKQKALHQYSTQYLFSVRLIGS
jgi:hypothetical protein